MPQDPAHRIVLTRRRSRRRSRLHFCRCCCRNRSWWYCRRRNLRRNQDFRSHNAEAEPRIDMTNCNLDRQDMPQDPAHRIVQRRRRSRRRNRFLFYKCRYTHRNSLYCRRRRFRRRSALRCCFRKCQGWEHKRNPNKFYPWDKEEGWILRIPPLNHSRHFRRALHRGNGRYWYCKPEYRCTISWAHYTLHPNQQPHFRKDFLQPEALL